jgi:energy-coupling factor transporter ATP-binding protein EcfA2
MANVRYVSATRVFGKGVPPAVDGLDLDINDGEFMVLVGPSGPAGGHEPAGRGPSGTTERSLAIASGKAGR